MQMLPKTGTMLAVLADESTVEEVIELYSDKVSIAAVNSKENIVISGTIEAIESIATDFETRKIEISTNTWPSPTRSPDEKPRLNHAKPNYKNFPRKLRTSTLAGRT